MLERMRENKERARKQREMEKISNDLKKAAEKGMWEVVKKIVSQYGADDTVINSPRMMENGMPAETALTLAVQKGLTETVKELLQAPCINSNTNNFADQMNTPLLSAVMLGYTEIVIALAAVPHINVNMIGGMGVSPLIYAVYHCQGAIPALLAAKTMVVNSCDNDRRTPLMHAVLNPVEPRNSVPKAVMLLINARDINLDAVDQHGWTAMMFAAQRGNAEIVRALHAAGAKSELQNFASKAAADIAAQFKHDEIAAFLRDPAAHKLQQEPVVSAQPDNQPVSTVVTAAPAANSVEADQERKSSLTSSRIMRFFTRAKITPVSESAPEKIVTSSPA